MTANTVLGNASATGGAGLVHGQGETEKPVSRQDALVTEYEEIADNFRTLTETRFELLKLLALAAGVASVVKPETGTPWLLPFALIGLTFTLSIVTYNKRNDQLYDELIGRAASIERELGVPDGAFANRPASWLSFGIWKLRWPINHRMPVSGIYIATTSFWLFLALDAVGVIYSHSKAGAWLLDWWARQTGDDYTSQARMLAHLSVAACAVGMVLVGTGLLKLLENWHRSKVKDAVSLAYAYAHDVNRNVLAAWADALKASMQNPKKKLRIREFEPNNPDLSQFARQCARAKAAIGNRKRARLRIYGQIKFYGSIPADSLRQYGLTNDNGLRPEYLVALLTDLPPRWIYDVSEGRR
jgi:hypothetical protein